MVKLKMKDVKSPRSNQLKQTLNIQGRVNYIFNTVITIVKNDKKYIVIIIKVTVMDITSQINRKKRKQIIKSVFLLFFFQLVSKNCFLCRHLFKSSFLELSGEFLFFKIKLTSLAQSRQILSPFSVCFTFFKMLQHISIFRLYLSGPKYVWITLSILCIFCI